MNRKRLEFAAEKFLLTMGQEYLKANPEGETPVKTLADYSPTQRSMLMRAVGKAILASTPQTDAEFNAWGERQRAEQVET
jgi:hypothetical protein